MNDHPHPDQSGWHWFDESGNDRTVQAADSAPADLCRCYARCFNTAEGKIVLNHLKRMTLERVFGPTATDAALRHQEGQRQLFTQIESLINQGQAASQSSFISSQE